MTSRRLLTRSWAAPASGVVLRDGTDGNRSTSRRIGGLAVPFGTVTRIYDPIDGEFDEQFARGAFKRTLGQRTPVMQFEHGRNPMLGSLPLGRFTRLAETRRGLEFDAEMLGVDALEPVLAAVRAGLLGVSISFRPVHQTVVAASERAERVPLVTVTEAQLLELGPVVFPAYGTTQVEGRNRTSNNDRARRARLHALRAKEILR